MRRATNRRQWMVATLLACLGAAAIAEVGGELATLVRQQTDESQRENRLARQVELSEWFHEHGRRVPRDAELATAEDRRNAAEFHGTMSNFLFLKLPRRERRRAAVQLTAYAAAVEVHGEDALRAVCADPAVLARWRSGPAMKAVSFAGTAAHAPAAVYVPERQTIYLDFNQAVDPAAFADAFEHELWHHLVSAVRPPDVGGNLFWEGFNEALSELWAAELRDRAGLRELGPGKVSYPVSAALATLCLATDREGTLAWLLGEQSQAEFAEGLQKNLPALADEFRSYPDLGRDRQREVEALLADWNWREDDGSPPRLDSLLADGTISAERIAVAFRLNRAYLEATIDALAVVWLRRALVGAPRHSLPELGALPAPLHENLERVRNYLRDPAQPLR